MISKKIFYSALRAGILSGLVGGSVASAEVKPFGHAGAIANVGFGSGNNKGYLGLSGNIGIDVNLSGLKLGAGLWAGFAPLTINTQGGYTSNVFTGQSGLYQNPWVELSDFYLGYDSDGFKFALGRYNAVKILKTTDWIGGHNQGLALAYNSDSFGVWATVVNDYLKNGYNANANLAIDGRYGMDLSSMGYYHRYNAFHAGRSLYALGFDIKAGEGFSLSPYVQYWAYSNPTIQAGLRLIASVNLGPVKSNTTLRFLWSNNTQNNVNGFMYHIDEEFIISELVKIGGGFLHIGGISLGNTSIIDRTRFYGQYLLPNSISFSGTGLSNRSYLNAGVNTWYVFTGVKASDAIDVDILYAGGNYSEFSTIINYNILSGGEGLKWSVGGGYVTNGFGSQHTGLVFTKVVF